MSVQLFLLLALLNAAVARTAAERIQMVALFFLGCFGLLLLISWIIQKRRGDTPDFYDQGDVIDTRRMVSRLSMTSRSKGDPKF